MADTEKITINMGSIDLGKIDLLVEEGFYSNRADFIRMAVRLLLENHQDVVKQATVRRSAVLGVLSYNRQDLEKRRAKGEKLDIHVIGALILADDIPPDLAREVIRRIQVFGSLRANPAIQAALADRINEGR
jgi:Arc/MetJ-type ribon-helix-helix transcriptional regulator